MVSDQLEEAVFLFLVFLEKSMYNNESETCLGLWVYQHTTSGISARPTVWIWALSNSGSALWRLRRNRSEFGGYVT